MTEWQIDVQFLGEEIKEKENENFKIAILHLKVQLRRVFCSRTPHKFIIIIIQLQIAFYLTHS
jgi:hypothetical protein